MTIPDERFTDAHGTTYDPWTNGHAIGFECIDKQGRMYYVYLNPSGEDDNGLSNVFVYSGPHGDPAEDSAEHYYPTTTAACEES